MARCTAPVEGHRSASAAARCPACRGRYGGGYSSYSSSYSGYSSYGYSSPSYSASRSSGGGRNSGGGSGRSAKPRWSRAGSSVWYTPEEVRALTPVRNSVEDLAKQPDLRDVFLCHAWDDRQGAAKQLHDLLESRDVSVWFSEKDVGLGVPLLRAIDKGLANSRIGIVLVTPACCAASQQRASPTKSFRHSSRVTGSFPLCTKRRMKLSAKSAPCSPREAA